MAGLTGRRQVLRRLGALVAGVGIAAVAACAPVTTQLPYAPSDGARAVLGDEVTVENLLVLTTAEGEPALVVGGVTNRSDEATTVSLTVGETSPLQVTVDPHATVLLNPTNGETLILDASPAAPGASVPVTISTPTAGSTSVEVTVLDGTLAPYDAYLEYLQDAPA
jgi:hypothetical protein